MKRVELKLANEEECTLGFHVTLAQLVGWLYQDRVQTRKKLFADRVTLELNEKDTFGNKLYDLLQRSTNEGRLEFSSRHYYDKIKEYISLHMFR